MIDGDYEIVIDTPMGQKLGAVALRVDGSAVIGDIDAPFIGKQHVRGTLDGGDSFSASGIFKVMFVGKIEYALRGKVEGDDLRIDIESNKGAFVLLGRRVR